MSVLTAQIEAKFSGRVIPRVGLCVCLHSYERIGDPYVYPSDGAAHYKVCGGTRARVLFEIWKIVLFLESSAPSVKVLVPMREKICVDRDEITCMVYGSFFPLRTHRRFAVPVLVVAEVSRA